MLTLLREADYMAPHLKWFGSDVAVRQPVKLKHCCGQVRKLFKNS